MSDRYFLEPDEEVEDCPYDEEPKDDRYPDDEPDEGGEE